MAEEKINDKTYEKIFNILSYYALGELDELISFEEKTDKQREEIIKVVMKSIETSTVVLNEFMNKDALNHEKIDQVAELLINKQFKEAHQQVFADKS